LLSIKYGDAGTCVAMLVFRTGALTTSAVQSSPSCYKRC
jgi:hypothetical protein